MEFFAVKGGRPLEGTVAVHGAKNSALPILAATLLARGESVLHNCPDLTDIQTALEILAALGCRVRREGRTVLVDTTDCTGTAVPDELMGRMRASVLFLGSLLARGGEAAASWPGGCALGARPIDLHIRAFQALGTEVLDREGRLLCRTRGLRGCRMALPFPSVGATENAMLAACGAAGVTIIHNAAREPEIQDLQGFLRSLGADVRGAGTGEIVIRGGVPLHPGEYTIMADRIVTATYLCAVAAAGGEGEFFGSDGAALLPVLDALEQTGCRIRREPDRVRIWQAGKAAGIGSVTTGPYPGFPTDAQPLLAAVLAGGRGETRITETIFDSRFRYVESLRTMGARIRVEGTTAWITGTPLRGADLEADDLRGGAALTIAALGAEGESRILSPFHIDRGYERLEKAFQALGGRIRRMNE
ncbi:MAG: UDP-N-acetylglucosamine 1-carboxyvinyltransferase [Bacillota bacterium]|nr:UDP-N-acetylglucosamine 1-carboxyvinyltransferase [Bacillota bacterium]